VFRDSLHSVQLVRVIFVVVCCWDGYFSAFFVGINASVAILLQCVQLLRTESYGVSEEAHSNCWTGS
jgi:hypothetical protein